MLELLVAQLRGAALLPIARLRTRREGVRADGAEIVHDTVAVLDHQRVTRSFEELEVELLDGDERTLRRIEKELRRAGAADGERRPKVFQALDLDFQAEAVGAPDDASSAAKLRARIREQAERVLAHDPGTRLGTDAEELHQMRVATRRLRAFLRAGSGLLDPEWVEPVREELKWLGGSLGPVRDLDVLVEHLAAEVESLGDDRADGRKLLRTLERSRRTARRKLIAALDSDRYFALLDTLEQPVATIADAPTLDEIHAAEHKRLRKAVRALDDASSDEELHAVRIHVKRARYSAELSGADAYVKAAKALQDVLGEHQDAVVAAERLRQLAQRMPDTAVAAGRLHRARAGASSSRARRVAVGVEETGEDGVVRAAGGVVLQGGRLLLVHRPKYDDWTFPKGKAEPGESDEDCAVREVEEEAGLRCVLGAELPSTHYTDSRGRPKRVRWWRMEPVGGEFTPSDEVDEIRWLTREEAAELLSYDRDQALLDGV